MAQSLEDTLREIFGEPFDKLTKFQSDQMNRVLTRIQEMAREAVKSDLARLQSEITELRTRIVQLENERATAAAEGIEPVI
jgi:polyhydroxyalkanoate synthesis regulator phasin